MIYYWYGSLYIVVLAIIQKERKGQNVRSKDINVIKSNRHYSKIHSRTLYLVWGRGEEQQRGGASGAIHRLAKKYCSSLQQYHRIQFVMLCIQFKTQELMRCIYRARKFKLKKLSLKINLDFGGLGVGLKMYCTSAQMYWGYFTCIFHHHLHCNLCDQKCSLSHTVSISSLFFSFMQISVQQAEFL